MIEIVPGVYINLSVGTVLGPLSLTISVARTDTRVYETCRYSRGQESTWELSPGPGVLIL
jgi:hypothetical protein